MTIEVITTIWIILQVIVKASQTPKLYRFLGKSDEAVMGKISGVIIWGILLISALYFGGFYD